MIPTGVVTIPYGRAERFGGRTELETDDDAKEEESILKLKVTFEGLPMGDTAVQVGGTAKLKDKVSRQNTTDGHNPTNPNVTPTFNATAVIKLRKPAIGQNGGTSLGGSVSQSFSHTATTTTWTIPNPGGGVDPPGYGEDTSSMPTEKWNANPAEPGSDSRWVSTKVETEFDGSVEEIEVIDAHLKAMVELIVNPGPPVK